MSAIYQHIKITLTAGEARDIAVAGSYLRLLSNSITTNPYVRIGQNPEQIIKSGIGVKLADGQKFGLVTFRNPHATDPMTLEIASGDGLIDDASLVISGTVITDDTNSDDIKTAVEATKLNSDDIKTAVEATKLNSDDITTAVEATKINTDTIKADVASAKANTRSINGDTGAQIVKSAQATNATSVIHTVTAGKTLYLSSVHCSCQGIGAAGYVFIDIVTADDSNISYLVYQYASSNGSTAAHNMTFPYPIKVPAGYKVRVRTGVAGVQGCGLITGWEE